MQRKAQTLSRQLAESLAAWPEVEAVILGEEVDSEIADPYFAFPLDVYHRGELPSAPERRERFGAPAAFEAVPGGPNPQDRFLLEELPVRIRYQALRRFEELLERIEAGAWVFHEAGTNLFYRLAHGQVLYSRSPWPEKMQEQLRRLPEPFWLVTLEGAQSGLAYALNDMRASALRADAFGYALSLARFLRSLASFLFALNRSFEPAPRLLSLHLLRLPRLPDGFAGRFESLLRDDPELPRERKVEVAELLARSVLAMV